MRYTVAVKQVPDTMEMSVDDNGSLVREGVPAILNPYDEYALSRVLEMKGADDVVTVFSMGPKQAEAALRRCLELGADEAFLLTDRGFAGSDVWATARTLAAFIMKYVCDSDLIVFGRQAIDGDTGQVPYEVAALLDVQQFAYVESLERGDGGFTAVQDYGDVRRTVRVPPGSVVSFGSVDPNGTIPTMEGYLRGASAGITEVDRVALGLGAYSVGLKGSMTRIVSTSTAKGGRRNRKVEIRDPAKGAQFIIDDLEVVR